jgi:hypothetical protein
VKDLILKKLKIGKWYQSLDLSLSCGHREYFLIGKKNFSATVVSMLPYTLHVSATVVLGCENIFALYRYLEKSDIFLSSLQRVLQNVKIWETMMFVWQHCCEFPKPIGNVGKVVAEISNSSK